MDFEELYADFFVEALGLLDDFEETFVNMESSDSPEKDMSQIFRVAHSIKGGAGALGFKEITEFTHCLEDILSYLRIHPEKLTPEIVTLCLDSADQLRKCFLNLQKNPQAVTHFNMTKLKEVSLSLNGNLHGDSDASQENLENEIKSSEDVSLENSELMPSLNTKEPQNFENSQVSDLSSKIESVQEVVSKQSLASEAQASEGDKSNKSQAKNSRIIKVDAHRLDNILDIVGELVVLKNQLLHDDAFRVSESTRAASVIDQIDKNVRDLYDKTLGMRMTPLKALFTKLQRIVRDVSLQLDKSVQLKLQGEDTEVERNVFDLLSDPLVHIVRNALDHGIEIPEKRKAANKPAQASLTIFAQQSGGKVVIEVIDDGNGIDREKILKKAIEKDLVTPNMNVAQMSDEQVFQFLFMPGFSTAEKISDLSGRGVGLDVVKTNLEKINGKIDVKSKLGHGTTFRLSLPLSAAITDGIVVKIDSNQYIIPIYSIRELVQVPGSEVTHLMNGDKVVKIRENLFPVLNADKVLGEIKKSYEGYETSISAQRRSDNLTLVILETLHGVSCFPVDEILGQAQVVVKTVHTGANIPEVGGAAIMGDGRTVLILDPTAITANQMTSSLERQVAA